MRETAATRRGSTDPVESQSTDEQGLGAGADEPAGETGDAAPDGAARPGPGTGPTDDPPVGDDPPTVGATDTSDLSDLGGEAGDSTADRYDLSGAAPAGDQDSDGDVVAALDDDPGPVTAAEGELDAVGPAEVDDTAGDATAEAGATGVSATEAGLDGSDPGGRVDDYLAGTDLADPVGSPDVGDFRPGAGRGPDGTDDVPDLDSALRDIRLPESPTGEDSPGGSSGNDPGAWTAGTDGIGRSNPGGFDGTLTGGFGPAGTARAPFTRPPGMVPPPGQGDQAGGWSPGAAGAPGTTGGGAGTSAGDPLAGESLTGEPLARALPDEAAPGTTTPPDSGGTRLDPQVDTAGPVRIGPTRPREAIRTRAAVTPRGPRRARLHVKRVDPWSVMKFSFAVSLVLFIVVIVAASVLYLALDTMGVFDSINNTVADLIQAGDEGGFQITAQGVIGTAAVLGAVNILLFTSLATLGAFIYNVCADLVGGVEVTLAERD